MKIFGFQIRRTPRPTPADLVLAAQAEERQATLARPPVWLRDALGAAPTASGVAVNEETAMRISAVYACVRVLSESVAMLPLKLYRRDGRARELASGHPLYRVLHRRPNRLMSAMQLREVMMVHLALWGNAYCEIQRDGAGQVVGLWPIPPHRVQVIRDHEGKEPRRRYKVDGTGRLFDEEEIFHVAGMGFDGYEGKSPIRLFREGLGIAVSAEAYGARFFANDARPGVVLTHPGVLGEVAYQRLRADHNAMHQGTANAYRLSILEEGMDVKTVSLPPGDAQFIETRTFQKREIASIYRVPAHMIGDLERATFSNIEHLGIEFVVHTLQPWLVRIEQAVQLQLLDEREQEDYYAEHLVDGLLRGDIQSRYQAYVHGRNWGWLSANDIRELENLDPIEDGDVYLQPLNMVPAGTDLGGLGLGERSIPDAPAQLSAPQLPAPRREARALPSRYAEAEALEATLLAALERVIRREVRSIRAALEEHTAGGVLDAQGFGDWLVEFAEEHGAWMEGQMRPAFAAMAAAMAEAASEELGADVTEADLAQFVADYTAGHARRHTGSTRGQLLGLSEEEDAAEAIEERLDEWEEGTAAGTRAEKEARRERQRSSNALTRAAWAVAGVAALTWRSIGKSCPLCQQMDGRSTSITSAFLNEGASIGGLTTPSRILHPPLHDGCDCILMPGLGRRSVGAEELRSFSALLGGVEAEAEPAGYYDRRDAEIRAAYEPLKAELGSALQARLELGERYGISERQVRRILHEGGRA